MHRSGAGRFDGFCLVQSRGALIYHLMGYEFQELYPINPSQLASCRETFSPEGAKDGRPDAIAIGSRLENPTMS